MERLVSASCRKLHNDDPIPNVIDLAMVANPPYSKIYGSYHSDQETSSEDELSGLEFGGNYTISKPRQRSRPYKFHDDYVSRSLSTLEEQRRIMRLHIQQQMSRARTNPHIAAAGESAILPVLHKAQLASQIELEAHKDNILPEMPRITSSGACIDDGKDPKSLDSVQDTVCGPKSEHKSSVPTSSEHVDNFTSQCSIRQRCARTHDSSDKDTAAENLSPSTRAGPVVNHYPQPKRRGDVNCAIADIDDVFELPKASKISKPAEDTGIELRRRLTAETDNSGQYSSIWEEYWSSSSGSPNPDPFNGTSKNPQDNLVDGFVQIIGEDYHNSEPVDGEHDGWQSSGTPNASNPPVGRSPSGPTQNGSGGSGKRNRSTSRDRPNPQSPPTKKSVASVESEVFPCVFHNPSNPEVDETLDCKTLHRYVSHLRVHHAADFHGFYYCTNCFARFLSKRLREAHDPKHCRNFKCVTEGCPNFNTFEVSTCDHPTKKNSQKSVWTALFRLAQPSHTIPLSFGDRTSTFSPAAGPSTPARRVGLQTSDMNIASPSRMRGHLSSTQSSGASFLTRGSLSREIHEIDPCFLGLRALTRTLLDQLDAPDADRLEILHHMYSSYMDHETQDNPTHGRHSTEDGAMQGIRTLNAMLWEAVQNPNGPSPARIRHLRAWADDILPKRELDSVSTVTSPLERQTPQQPQTLTPTPIPADPSRDGHQRAHSVPVSNFYPGSHAYDQSFNALLLGDMLEFNLDLYNQPSDTGSSSLNDLPPPLPAQYPNTAPMYYPWTHRDSAEALPHDGRALSKTRTRDSGYSTGRTNNSS